MRVSIELRPINRQFRSCKCLLLQKEKEAYILHLSYSPSLSSAWERAANASCVSRVTPNWEATFSDDASRETAALAGGLPLELGGLLLLELAGGGRLLGGRLRRGLGLLGGEEATGVQHGEDEQAEQDQEGV